MNETIDIKSKETWEMVKRIYLSTLSSAEERGQVERYFSTITSVTRENGLFVITLTNAYTADFLRDKYSDKLKKCLELVSSDTPVGIEFRHSERAKPPIVIPTESVAPHADAPSKAHPKAAMASTMPLNEDYTFDNFDAQKLQNVAEKVLQLFYGHGNASYDYKHYGNDAEQDDIRNMFAAGNAAMATLRIMALESAVMRDMKDEYGVVPMPKYDEAQKDYGTLLHDQFTVLSIPKTALDDRRDRISAVMEALCYTSYNIVRPAYYDVALRSKLVSDPDSAEMLDLLFSKVYIDAGVIYTGPLSGFHDQFRQLMGQKSNRVMSTYQKKARSTRSALQKNIVQKLQKLYDSGNA